MSDKNIKNNNIIFSVIPGFILAVLLNFGFHTRKYRSIDLSLAQICQILGLWILVSLAIYGIYNLLDLIKKHISNKPLKNIDNIEIKGERKNDFSADILFWLSALLLFFIWFPSFLAFYPGIFAYDNQWQYYMFVNNEISAHQPVIHTLILGAIIHWFERITGSINKGVAAYTLFQAAIMSLGLAYIPYIIKRKGEKIWFIIFSLVFSALYPVLVIFVFTGTKDSIFSVAVVDFTALNFYLLSKKNDSYFEKKKDIVFWCLFAFVILTFRGNAVYALLLSLPFLFIYVMKNCKKKKSFFIALGITAALFLAVKYPLTLSVIKENVPKSEMMSVPCQQLARVYHYHKNELDEKDIEKYDMFFDAEKWYGYYVPEIADASKGSLRIDVYDSKKGEYWGLWAKWFKEYPFEYINSFLENTYGFTYPWPRYVLYSFGKEGYTVLHPMQPVEQNSKIPLLFKFYENFEDGAIVQKNVYASWLFAPATFLYIFIVIVM